MEFDGLREIFAGEAEEILQDLEVDIVNLEENSDPDIINKVFRSIHTLKGSSGIAGFNEISEFTHKIENLLEKVRCGELTIQDKLINILLESMDWIRISIFGRDQEDEIGIEPEKLKNDLIDSISQYNNGKDENIENLYKDDKEAFFIEDIEEREKRKSLKESLEKYTNRNFFRIKAEFRENIFEYGIDPLMIIEDLASLGTFEERRVNRSKLPSFKNLDPEKCYISWDLVLETEYSKDHIEDVFLFVKDDNKISIEDVTTTYHEGTSHSDDLKKIGQIMVDKKIITEEERDEALEIQDSENKRIAEIIVEKGFATKNDVKEALDEQEKIKTKIETSTVRVATKKLDSLLNLLGEIVIGQSSISRIADQIVGENGFRLKNALYGLDRTTREFQEQIMSIRMIPIGPSFEQFRRFVRDTAKSNGKDIKLYIEGGETELDKTVIERMGDPLKHMIRNAMDHGIETPEERIRAGKSSKGRIILKAYHQKGNVFIEVIDDGKGINKEMIRKKAEEKGLIDQNEEMSDEKILSCLFMPGFSTAEKVGELSGRGVGMDVVKNNIEALRGMVEIDTEENVGTTFRIKLPLTLAIVEGMLVRVGKYTYIIPLLSILESIKPVKEDIKTIEGRGEVIFVRGQYVTLIRLYQLFGIESDYVNPWESLVVIVESNGVYMGVMVDDLIGQQQIVIKSLDSHITNSRIVSGATILGDGTVSLILDVHGLVDEITR